MKCPLASPTSSSLSSEHVARYAAAVDRWRATSALSTRSTGPAAEAPDGLSQPEESGLTTSSLGTSAGRIGGPTELFERLAALALASQATQDGPPIRTYRSRAGVDGTETVVATEEYRQWFCGTFGVARDEVPRAAERAADAARERGAEAAGGWRGARMKKPT